MNQVEPLPSLEQPHTLIFFIATLACLAVTLLPGIFFRRDRRWERRVYWGGTASACICFLFACLPDWKLGVGMAMFGAGMMTASAYVYTPYIKLRGKIRAFHVDDILSDDLTDSASATSVIDHAYDAEPDAYAGAFGLTTAKKMWWLAIFLSAMCVLCVVIRPGDKPWWITPLAGSFLVMLAIGFGYLLDGSWGYSVARGQRVQFGIIAIITAGIFTMLYLGAYYAGKRWPYRNKKAMEFGMRPHGWKQDP